MAEKEPDQALTASSIAMSGPPLVTVTLTRRKMKSFSITEGELNNLGTANTLAGVFGSVALAFLVLFAERLLVCLESKSFQGFFVGAPPYLLLLGFVFAAAAVISVRHARSTIKRIQGESETLTEPPTPPHE